jgi:DNA-binding IscR family transcriptional regulator
MAGKSSRFTVAVHILTLLAHEEGKATTSDYIAGSVNTNPVVVRRTLGLLAKAKLVMAVEGAGGGNLLARRADRITLADVFHAVEQGELFSLPRSRPNPLCPVGRSVQGVIGQHAADFEKAMDRQMRGVTIADMLAGIRAAK